MARIAGVDIPKNKRGVIALTYIFGIGRSRAIEVGVSSRRIKRYDRVFEGTSVLRVEETGVKY